MIRAYVYRCEHKKTGHFYIGYRKANRVPAHEDFGIFYFSSCPLINEDFNSYTFEILSEYDSGLMAFEVEQRLLFEFRNNKLLNKNFKKRNLIEINPKPIDRSVVAWRKLSPIIGPRKRSSPIPHGVKKRKRRENRRRREEIYTEE